MEKDAFYFPHFCNARQDRKIKRVRKELGLEGYGIYFMLLETLREQQEFKFPTEDIDLLADEFGTSEQKIRTVICNYDLFQLDNNENFFSVSFIKYLTPYLEGKQRKKIAGIKGNLIKYGYAKKEDLDNLTDLEILEINENKNIIPKLSHSDSDSESSTSRNGSQRKVNEKESKEKEKENIPYKEIIDCLNSKAGTNYKYTTNKTKELIKARFNENFSLKDFETVINKKCYEWLETDMNKFLRPETLFGTKFESYLNQTLKNYQEQTPVIINRVHYDLDSEGNEIKF